MAFDWKKIEEREKKRNKLKALQEESAAANQFAEAANENQNSTYARENYTRAINNLNNLAQENEGFYRSIIGDKNFENFSSSVSEIKKSNDEAYDKYLVARQQAESAEINSSPEFLQDKTAKAKEDYNKASINLKFTPSSDETYKKKLEAKETAREKYLEASKNEAKSKMYADSLLAKLDKSNLSLVDEAYKKRKEYDKAVDKQTELKAGTNFLSTTPYVDNDPRSMSEQDKSNEIAFVVKSTLDEYNASIKKIENLGYSNKEAKKIVEEYGYQKQAEERKAVLSETKDYINDGNAVKAELAGFALNAMDFAGTIANPLNKVKQLADTATPGRTAKYDPLAEVRDDLQSSVVEKVNKEHPNGVEIAGVNYNAAEALKIFNGAMNSAIDIAIGSLVGMGVNSALGVVANSTVNASKISTEIVTSIMGSQTASTKLIDMKQNGASDTKAIATATLYGFATYLTEHLPIENVFKGNFGKAVITEGLEEVSENILDGMIDLIICGGQDTKLAIANKIIEENKTEQEAIAEVLEEMLGENIEAFISGAISGAGMAGTAKAMNSAYQNKYLSELGTNLLQTENSKELSQILKFAQKNSKFDTSIQKSFEKVNKNKNPSNIQVGSLFNSVQEYIKNSFDKVTSENEAYSLFKDILDDNDSEMIKTLASSEFISVCNRFNNSEQNKKQTVFDKVKSKLSNIKQGSSQQNNTQSETTDIQENKTPSNTLTQPITASDTDGNTIEIASLTSTNGNVAFKTSSGEVINSVDVTINNDVTNSIIDYVKEKNIGSNGATVLIDYSNNGNKLESVLAFVDAVYSVGKSNQHNNFQSFMNTLRRGNLYNLINDNRSFAESLFVAAQKDGKVAEAIKKEEQKAIKKANTKKAFETALNAPKKNGVTNLSTNPNSIQKAEIELIDELAKNIKRDIIIVDNTEDIGYGSANGFYKNDKIILSLDNQAGMMSVYLGHELLHDIKVNSPELANQLQDFIIERLQQDKSYDLEMRVAEICEQYGFEGENAREQALEEIAANACFGVLSQQTNVEALAKENKTLLIKVRDFFNNFIEEIKKALTSIAKANAEYRSLHNDVEAYEKILKMFNEALNTNIENSIEISSSTKFSIKENSQGFYVDIDTDQDIFENLTDKESIKIINKYMRERFKGKVFPLSDNTLTYVGRMGINEYTHPARKNINTEIYNGKLRAGTELDNLLAVSVFDSHKIDDGHHPEAVGGWDNYKTYFKVGNKFYEGIIRIENRENGREFKDITKIKEINRNVGQSAKAPADAENLFNNIISNSNENVKKSLKDSDGNTLSPKQQEYFSDSKVRDENGNLLVMYHGTPNADFTKFRSGSYFTQNKEYAQRYESPGASSLSYKTNTSNPNTYKVYLNIKKPFDTRNAIEREIFENEFYMKWGNGSPLSERGLPDWLEAMDLQEFIEENEYDYDGLIVDEGGEGGYGLPVYDRGLAYVTFEANQVKNADNLNPTDDPDIRFSLKNVEETKDLIAVHNLSEEKLLKSLNLGGLPMPSIAVMKAKEAVGNSDYGNISLVFQKDTIDPELSPYNKIYSGDAWTPVYPTVEYKVNADKANEIYSRAINATKDTYAFKINSVRFHPSNIEDALNNRKGEQGLIEYYKDDYGMKQLYLAETAEPVKDVKTKETRTELSEKQVEMYDYLLEHFGDTLSILDNGTYPARKWINENGEDFDKVRRDYYRKLMPDITEEQLDNIFTNLNENALDKVNLARSINRYKKNGRVTVETENDYKATEEEIDSRINPKEYESWLNDFFSGIAEKKGIRNNLDKFTNSGNERTFEQLHYEENLENVIKQMRTQKNGDVSLFVGLGIWGVAAKSYGTIDEIKSDSFRLQNLSDEEFSEVKQNLAGRLDEIAKGLDNKYQNNNFFIDYDNKMTNILDAIRYSKTKTGMLSYLNKYFKNATESTVDDILDLVADIGNMPVSYFEAKPQRAVDFNEVYTAIIPDNSSSELIEALQSQNIEYFEYEAGNEEARRDMLNSLADAKFSRKESNNRLNKQNEELRDIIDNLEYRVKLLSRENTEIRSQLGIEETRKVSTKSVEKIASKLIKKWGGERSYKKILVSKLNHLYNYIEGAGVDIDGEYISQQCSDIATNLLSNTNYKDTTLYDEYKEVRNHIRNTKIYVSDEVKADLADYEAWRRRNFGKIRTSADGVPLDTIHKELVELAPAFFSEDAVLSEQLIEIEEFFNSTAVTYRNTAKEMAEYENISLEDLTNMVALEIYDSYFEAEEIKDYSSSVVKEQMSALKKEYNQMLNEIADDYKTSYQEELEFQRTKYNNEIQKLEGEISQLHQEQADTDRTIVNLLEEKKRARVKALKEQAEALSQQKAHFTEVNERAKDRRTSSVLKNKIRRLKSSLDSALTNPNESRYIPRELVSDMANICDKLTNAERYWKNGKEKSPETILRLDRLHRKYEALKNDPDYIVKEAYDDITSTMISILADKLEGKQLSAISSYELQEIYDTLRAINALIINARKLIDSSIKVEAHEASVKLIEQQLKTKGSKSTLVGMHDFETLNVMRFINVISEGNEDGILNIAFKDLEKATRNAEYDKMTWSSPFMDLLKMKEFKNFRNSNIDTGLKDINGNKVVISEDILCTLILSAKREQGRNHILGNGVTFLNENRLKNDDYKGAYKNGVITENLDVDNILRLYDKLSPYGKKWIDEAHKLLTLVTKDAINEVSLKTKHQKLANDENYIPLFVDKNDTGKDLQAVFTDSVTAEMGFTKALNKYASNRIMIMPISMLVDKYIEDVSYYVNIEQAVKNINKIMNGKTSSFYDAELLEKNKRRSISVREILNDKWKWDNRISNYVGDKIKYRVSMSATSLIENCLKDLRGTGWRNPSTSFSQLVGQLQSNKVSAVFKMNLSIVLKQAASYPTAVRYIGSRALAYGAKTYANITPAQMQSVIDRSKRYGTATLYNRTLGLSTRELGDYSKSKLAEGKQISIYDPANWIQLMDTQTVSAIFVACEKQVELDNKGIDKTGKEYMQKVVELFDKTVENTQPMYDVLHRPEILKEQHYISRSLSMFQTEPLQMSGMVYDSFRDVLWKQRQFIADSSEKNKKALSNAKKDFAKSMWATTSSAIIFASMSFAISALLRKKRKEPFEYDFAQNVVNVLFPVVGDLVLSFYQEYKNFKSKNYYNSDLIENFSLKALNDFADSISNLIKITANENSTAEQKRKAVLKMISQSAELLGIPVNNAKNIAHSIIGWIDSIDGEMQFEEFSYNETDNAEDKSINKTKAYEDLFNTYKSSGKNSSEYKKLYDELIKSLALEGVADPEKSIKSAMENRAIKEYMQAKQEKDYDKYLQARQLAIDVFGSMDKVEQKEKSIEKAQEEKQKRIDEAKRKYGN